jgi:predicted nuclease with TOPRIM domain
MAEDIKKLRASRNALQAKYVRLQAALKAVDERCQELDKANVGLAQESHEKSQEIVRLRAKLIRTLAQLHHHIGCDAECEKNHLA